MPKFRRAASTLIGQPGNTAPAQAQSKDQILRGAIRLNHGIKIDGASSRIDHRGAGDTQRIDITARQRGHKHRASECHAPCGAPGYRIERHHSVTFRCDHDQSMRGALRMPIQRLRIDMAWHAPVEALIAIRRPQCLLAQRRDDIIAATARVAVIGGDGAIG